jgi:hypothetical protein
LVIRYPLSVIRYRLEVRGQRAEGGSRGIDRLLVMVIGYRCWEGAEEVETLCLLLTDQAQELLKRRDDIDSAKVKLMSRDEVFDV